jgi:hypothetical protein
MLLAQVSAGQLTNQEKDTKSGSLVDGFYELVPKGSATAGKKYVYVSTDSGQLSLKDLKTSSVLDGVRRSDGSVLFRKSRGLASTEEEVTMSSWPFDGVEGTWTTSIGHEPGTTGTTGYVPGAGHSIYVVKLLSVWECGNHTAAPHMAASELEMKEDEAKYSCQGWHKVPTPK